VLRADIKPIVDGEAAHRAASPSISVLTYLRIAISKIHSLHFNERSVNI